MARLAIPILPNPAPLLARSKCPQTLMHRQSSYDQQSTHLSADAVSSSSPLWLQLTQLTGPAWPTKVVPAPACLARGSHRQRAVLSLAAVSSLQPSPEQIAAGCGR
jgi:hypothetical protein